VYFYKLNTIDYLRLNNKKLSIHRGLFRPRKVINIEDIEQGRIIRDKLILIFHSEKEFEIHLKQLTINDYEKLEMKLGESFLIS
jgi:hypothetical protein